MTDLTIILLLIANAALSFVLYFHARATASKEYTKIYGHFDALVEMLRKSLIRKNA